VFLVEFHIQIISILSSPEEAIKLKGIKIKSNRGKSFIRPGKFSATDFNLRELLPLHETIS